MNVSVARKNMLEIMWSMSVKRYNRILRSDFINKEHKIKGDLYV